MDPAARLPAGDSPDGSAGGPTLRRRVRAAIELYNAGEAAAAHAAALPLAEAGDRDAQRLIGNVLAFGGLGSADVGAARPWWERAALSRDAAAQYNLGLSYLDDDAPGRDDAQGRAWLREAALGGHRLAMIQLGEALLAKAGEDLDAAAEGYAWLRVASFSRDAEALAALGRALQASSWRDGERDVILRHAALDWTPSVHGVVGPDLLGETDRDEQMAYYLMFKLCTIAGAQDIDDGALAARPDHPSHATMRDVVRALQREIDSRPGVLPAGTLAWPLRRQGFSDGGVEAAPLAAARLWEMVRPGDAVELSDGVAAHMTFVHSVDRVAGRIRFVDAWPDRFLLLAGSNALGIEARFEPLGKTRRLLVVERDDFVRAVRGVVSEVGPRSIAVLWRQLPELRDDPAAQLAVAALLAAQPAPATCAEGFGRLMQVLRRIDVAARPRDAAAAIDRAWIAAERLGAAGIESIDSGEPDSPGTATPLTQLCAELAQSFPPSFDTLAPSTLADAIERRASHATPGSLVARLRLWFGRPPPDPLLRNDIAGAKALLANALQRFPGNELLEIRQARLSFGDGEHEAALKTLETVIATLEAKRKHPGPLVRDLDGVLVGASGEREAFTHRLINTLALHASMLGELDRHDEALIEVQRAITLRKRDEPVLLQMLEAAARGNGDEALARDAAERRARVEFERLADTGDTPRQ